MYIINLLKFKLKSYYISFMGCFIKNKKLKDRFKSLSRYKNSINFISKLKWCISYSVFDGEELLESSLKSVRNNADYINVVYQTKSWYGNDCSDNLMSTLIELKNKGLIDELIEYKPNYKISAGKQELAKRNLGLKYAQKAHCDFFMTMDCDEFYFEKELKNSKIFIVNKSITNAFCKQIKYININKQQGSFNSCFVAIWAKINIFSKLKKINDFIILVDPTRNISRVFKFKPFIFHNVNMHHYTYVRKNLLKKFQNTSCNEMLNIQDSDMEKYIKDTNTIQVDNYFNIQTD